MHATSALDIQAVMHPPRIRPGGDAAIRLTFTQRGPERLSAPHPILSSEALVFHVRLPSGEERTVRTPPARPGTPPRQANIVLQPQVAQKFGIAVQTLVNPLTAGNYCIIVEYSWAPGQVWRSQPLSLTVE
jgi:hypothetical protein